MSVADFGASSPGLWASLDPVGCSLRTSVLLELEGLTGCALTWRLRDTPSGRLWWVLGRSEPRTEGSESGSWPTAQAQDAKQNGDGPRSAATMLIQQVRRSWTTPTQDDAGGRSARYKQGGTSLSAQLQGSARPTATAEDSRASEAASYSTESGRHTGTTLTDAANGLWARPQARDWKDSGPTQGNRKSPNLGTQAHAGLLDQGSHSTSGKSRDSWATPDSSGQNWSHRTDHGSMPLHRQIGVSRGVLNSRWVAQIMGYPSDWCDLPAEAIERLSKHTETRSSRRLSPSSDGRSSRRKKGYKVE